jgi:ELWxxDGT repeat protein
LAQERRRQKSGTIPPEFYILGLPLDFIVNTLSIQEQFMKKPPSLILPLSAALMCLLAGPVLGQGIALLKDVNAQPPAADSLDNDFVAVVNNTYFIATDDHLSGSELWKSDGTLAGTVLVKDIVPGPVGSSPKELTAVGTGAAARLYFVANTGGNDSLWISDGTTAGTRQVANPEASDLRNPTRLFAFGSTLYFEGQDGDHGRELWRADLSGNAFLVKDIAPGASSHSNVGSFTVFNGAVHFLADDGSGVKIWKTNAAGTAPVTDVNALPEFLTPFQTTAGARLFFSGLDPVEGGTGRDLWYSNGVNETALLFDVEVNGSSDPQSLAVIGGWLYFTGEQVGQTRRLYRTDGVSDNQGPITSSGGNYSEAGNVTPITVGASQLVLFTARDDGGGMELWRSNGTSGGNTIRAIDINPGGVDSNPGNFSILGPTTVLFTATDENDVVGLWKCEGGTGSLVISKVVDLPEVDFQPAVVRNAKVSSVNGVMKMHFFLNRDEFWITDGTAVGTTRIKQFRAGDTTPFTASSNPAGFAMHGTEAYFSADDGLAGRQVWKTDGTNDGTVRVSNIFPGSGFNPEHFASSGTHVYFSARDAEEDFELWRTDGSATELVKEIQPGDMGSNPANLLWSNAHDLLFFSADDGLNGVELWRSDGTVDGTFMVEDMAPFSGSNPAELTLFRDKLFFVGTSAQGRELQFSNGDPNDIQVMNIGPGSANSNPEFLTVKKNLAGTEFLYFVATVGSFGEELFVTDGALDTNGNLTSSTALVKDIIPGFAGSKPAELTVSGKFLFFTASSQAGSTPNIELWKSDGTSGGTVMVKEIAPGTVSSSPEQLVDVGGQLFFVANDGVNGAELWVSNGTSAGTLLVKNIVAGSGSPGIQDLRSINGVAVFSADDGVNGREIWISDGTAAGTFMVRDLTNDSSSSSPQHIFNFGERLLYSGGTYVRGQEPRLGNLVPEIAVEGPLGPLTNPDDVDFGNCSIVNVSTFPILIRNDGLNTLKALKAEITGVNAKEFTFAVKPPATLGPDAVFTLNVRFTPKAVGARTAVLTITSNDPDEGTYVLNLTGNGQEVFIAQPTPAAQLVQVGGSADFEVDVNLAGDSPPMIQWRKVAAPIAGATMEDFTISPVTLAHAALYTVQVKMGTMQTVSNPVALHVVDNTAKSLVVKAGTTATFKADHKLATTKPLTVATFEWWRKVGSNPDENLTLSADPRIKDANKAILKVEKTVGHANADMGDSGIYYCKVTIAGLGTVVGGTTTLNVFSGAPEIATFDPPNSIVGENYEYQVVMNTAMNNIAPTGFTVKGLPPGWKMDAKTGRIFGRATKGGTYTITVTASNAIGKNNPMGPGDDGQKTITIADLPTGVVGTFNCLVERNTGLNSNMGGRLDLTVATTGAFTGSLTLGTTKLPVKGELEASPTGAFDPRATITVKRAGKLTPLTLFIEFDGPTNTIGGNSQVNDDDPNDLGDVPNIAAIDGWRQVWNSSTKVGVANPATGYMGLYNLGLRTGSGPGSVPEGWGYASFTVAKDGKLSVAGKTADGEGITSATFVGPDGQVLVFQPLYMTTPKGSLRGQMTINAGAELLNPADNTLGGVLDWVRPEDTRKTPSRAYKKGFGHLGMPVEVDVFGGPWVPVTGDIHAVMGLPGSEFYNAEVVLDETEEALADASQIAALWNTNDVNDAWPPFFRIETKNKITLPIPNPTGLKFAFAGAKGTFNGSIALTDDNPRTIPPTGPQSVGRTLSFQGLIIDDGTDVYGVGNYMLPRLPGNGDANADPVVPPTTSTTSEIFSGSVIFRKRITGP